MSLLFFISQSAPTLVQVDWNRRDLLLYAAGIGAKKDDLPLVYGASCAVPLALTISYTSPDRAA